MDLNVSLLKWQQKVFRSDVRFKVIAAGRRCGKSRFAAWMLILKALQCPSGHVFYVAPTQGQARDIMWDVLMDLTQPVRQAAHVNNMTIKLINGATISLKGADRPDTMRGVSLYYLVLDEYADMKPEVWDTILSPALADQKGDALFIGTPMGRNHFYELFIYADAANDTEWGAWHFTSFDNETLDPEEIEKARKRMSKFAFRQEFMASFEALGSEIFKEEDVKYYDKLPEKVDGSYYIAIDLAGFETLTGKRKKNSRLDDSAIVVVFVTDDGNWYIEDMIVGRWTLNETAMKILNTVSKYKPTAVGIERGIAKQAVMSPLTDYMRARHVYFHVTDLTHGNQKKIDRVVWALQGRFENGLVHVKKGEWNIQFLDRLFQFPNHLVHDDEVDALAYIDQLAQSSYGVAEEYINDEYEYLDSVAGY